MGLRIGSDDFENKVLNAANPVLIDFYSDSCIACKKILPVLGEIEEEYDGKLDVYKINAVFEPDLANKYNILSTPTLCLFEEGRLKKQVNGALKKTELIEWIGEVL